jgi:hypothetical protein
LVWAIIASLVFTDIEMGTHSPFGLVLRHNLNSYEASDNDLQGNPLTDWVINIGGHWSNNFTSGIVIPIYVIVLGIIGGYLRYLHKSASKEKIRIERNQKNNSEIMDDIFRLIAISKIEEVAHDPILLDKLNQIKNSIATTEDSKEKTSFEFKDNTFAELSHIFLAPLLAAVAWFIITQGNPETNVYLLAAVSFAIGLVTKDIINWIESFMKKTAVSK